MTPDDIDQRIRAALNAEPAPEQITRLEQFWYEQSRAERRRRRRSRTLAIAATVLAVATGWIAFNRNDQRAAPQGDAFVQAPGPVEVSPAPSSDFAASQPEATPSDALPFSSRPPTAYERLVFAARTSAPIDPEQNLLAQLRRTRDVDEGRLLVVRLGEVGTPRSVPALLEAAERQALQIAAIAAVERIVGIDRLPDVVNQANSPAVRAGLMVRLLAADSPLSFLTLVANPATRGEALAVAIRAEQLPLDTLLQSLDAPDNSDRLAAALVLGCGNAQGVSDALIARISQPQRASIETWIALLARRDAAAERFLAQAAGRPEVLGQVNNARAYWARMMP